MARKNAAGSPRRQAPAGRPRDEQIDRRILAAAYDELVASGPERFSLRAVARRAEVSRAALERRWRDPAALAQAALEAALPVPTVADQGSLRADLAVAAKALATSMTAPGLELQMRIVADGRQAPHPLHLFQRQLLDPGREQIRAVFRRAVERSELDADFDIDWLADAFIGAILIRTTAHPSLRPPQRAALARIVDVFGSLAK